MRTLIIAPNWIGDAVMAQPLLKLLRAANPDQRIVALAPAWVAPVLDAMPEIDRVFATQLAHGKLQWRARRDFASALRREHFTHAFVLPNSLKSALIPWLAGIPKRIGYQGEMRWGLLNHRLAPPDPAIPMARRYLALAGELGIKVPATLQIPRLEVSADDMFAVREQFGLETGTPLFALCPGAEFGPAKRWPSAHYAQLANLLLEQYPTARILLLGGPGDAAIAEQIRNQTRHPEQLLQLAGQTTLAQAIALLATVDAVVSNDSGLMHVAAALQKPQAAIFGSSDPRHTPPLSSKAEILWLHTQCSPCFARTCPLGHLRCLSDLTPASVATAVGVALAGASHAPGAL